MSIQATLKINSSLAKKMQNARNEATEAKKKLLLEIAKQVTEISPVDTGAYVTSHSFKTRADSSGRSRSSKGKPTKQNPAQKKQEGFDQLVDDLNGINIAEAEKITLRNDSPHAQTVEVKHGYYVYQKIKQRFA